MSSPLDISVADIVIVIMILIPGFISVQLFKRIYLIEREFSEFEMTVWSIFTSFLIYVPFNNLAELGSIEDLRLSLFSYKNIGILLALTIVAGVVPASILRKWRKRAHSAGSVWNLIVDKVMKTQEPIYAIVYTKSGKEYYGRVAHFGLQLSPKDLIIKEPELLVRDKKLKVTRKPWGKDIYLKEDDIAHIVFMNDL